MLDDVTHLMCYEVRLASKARPFVAPETLFINNRFGEAEIGRFRPTELCVPAIKNPGICGDGVLGPLEDCDLADDGACPGTCSPQCTCL